MSLLLIIYFTGSIVNMLRSILSMMDLIKKGKKEKLRVLLFVLLIDMLTWPIAIPINIIINIKQIKSN